MLYDFFVGHLRKTSEVKFATNRALRHVAQIRRLLLREANGPHLLSRELRDPFRSEGFTCERRESLENRYRSLPIQLLIDDGLGQAMKLRRTVFDAARPHALNDATHHRIRFLQVIDSFPHAN